jgi:hypothetical protein
VSRHETPAARPSEHWKGGGRYRVETTGGCMLHVLECTSKQTGEAVGRLVAFPRRGICFFWPRSGAFPPAPSLRPSSPPSSNENRLARLSRLEVEGPVIRHTQGEERLAGRPRR